MRKNRIVPHWKELYILEVKANILNLVLLQSLSAWLLCVITPQPSEVAPLTLYNLKAKLSSDKAG